MDYNPPSTPMDIIYKDNDIICVNKPSGLLSVPGKLYPDCLESRLRAIFPEILTVHRLDMSTSGVMVFARSKPAQRHLGIQFEKRHLRKRYIARIQGHIRGESGRINLPLRTDWPNRPKQMVCFEKGRPSQTDWALVSKDRHLSKILLFPRTGRSHQLRVHLLAIGHPILGDEFYAPQAAKDAAERLQLHALSLDLRKPSDGSWLHLKACSPF